MKTMKRTASLIIVFSITMMAATMMPNAFALDLLNAGSETQGDMVIFPGYFGALVSNDSQNPNGGEPGSPAGWHLPGRGYRAGVGWWALACETGEQLSDNKKGCQLYATRLTVTKAKHAVYDDIAVKSQLLHWSPLPGNLDKVPQQDEKRPELIAVFKPIRSLAHLKLSAGPVRTYVHQGMSEYPPTPRPGTLEVRLSMGNGQLLDIVPRIRLPHAEPASTSNNDSERGPDDIDVFELRMGSQRQQLRGYTVDEMGGGPLLNQKSYLLWAGDLDNDGKPDLILNHGGYGVQVALYLSSLAKEGELVGLAGSFEYADPSSAGC